MCFVFVRIVLAVETTEHLERYRSGHNEAVLKTVCPQGRVGSNPTPSAIIFNIESRIRRSTQEAEEAPLLRV